MFGMKVNQGLMVVGMSLCTSSASFAAIVNTVTVTGTGPAGSVTASATETVDVVDANTTLTIQKLAAVSGDDTFAAAGEIITYTFKVKNEGNVTINDVEVVDIPVNATGAAVVPSNPFVFDDAGTQNDSKDELNTADNKWGALAPGDTLHFTAEYTVLQSDVDTLQD